MLEKFRDLTGGLGRTGPAFREPGKRFWFLVAEVEEGNKDFQYGVSVFLLGYLWGPEVLGSLLLLCFKGILRIFILLSFISFHFI